MLRISITYYSLGTLLITATGSYAQSDSIIHNIQEVTVQANYEKMFLAGQHIQTFDSTSLLFHQTQSLADLLSDASSLFVKSYGSGSATVTMNGGSAYHTSVLWKGYDVCDPMLGNADVSLLPVFFFNDIKLNEGGSSALFGSGNVSGTILLNNENKSADGLDVGVLLSGASFSKYFEALKFNYAKQNFSGGIKCYNTSAENDFPFINSYLIEPQEQHLAHADQNMQGVMANAALKIKTVHLSFSSWLDQAQRNLPPTMLQTASEASQFDSHFRNVIALEHVAKWNWQLTSAFFMNQLNYTDSLSNIFSNSKSNTWVSGATLFRKVNSLLNFRSGVDYSIEHAATADYLLAASRNIGSVESYLNLHSPKSSINVSLNVREEIADSVLSPFIFSLGSEFSASHALHFTFNGGRAYRRPTLNDLYWNPGGNPDLKSEQGWNTDAGFNWQLSCNKNFEVETDANVFGRWMNNWIVWLPATSSFIWSPQNLLHVWSRGVNVSVDVKKHFGGSELQLKSSAAYVRSQNQEASFAGDESVDKQLIYVPQWMANSALRFIHKNFIAEAQCNYTGIRFISSDNSQFLPAFTLVNFRLAKTFRLKQHTAFEFSGAVKNIFNTQYETLAYRPQPGRNFELSLTLFLNFKNEN